MKFEELVTNIIAGLPKKNGKRRPTKGGSTYELSRARALDFLFNVIGNGYDWDSESGELTCDKREEAPDFILTKDNFQAFKEECRQELRISSPSLAKMRERFILEDSIAESKICRDGYKEGSDEWEFANMIYCSYLNISKFKPYPISSISNICNLPDNIPQDYLEGAAENISSLREYFESVNDDKASNGHTAICLKDIKKVEDRIKTLRDGISIV